MVHSEHGATEAAPGVRGSRIALAGLLFSALFLLAWYLLRGAPPFDASDDQLTAYYADSAHSTESMVVGLYVIPLAGIAFIWFMAALRDRYVRTATSEHTILSTAHVVAGALVVVSLFTLAAVHLAVARLADAAGAFDVDGARSLLALGQASADIMALRSAAVFVGVSASRGMRSGLFPPAFGALSMVTAVLLLVGYEIAPWVSLVFPAWVAASAVLILVRRRSIEIVDGA
jgi:hypothetical protein